jgi:hypothetical protein
MPMKLQQLTGFHDGESNKITRIHFIVADDPDPAKRKQWIEAHIAVDLPTGRNGAMLRATVLDAAIDILRPLEKDLTRVGEAARGGP